MIKAADMNHNEAFDVATLKSGGFGLVIHKVSQGKTFADPKYAERMKFLNGSGIMRSGYHWCSPETDGVEQANWFLAHFDMQSDIMPFVDFEEFSSNVSSQHHYDVLKVVLDTIEAKIGRKPGIYTGQWFLAQLAISAPAWIADYPLWLSDYDHAAPVLPHPWAVCAIHQCDAHLQTHGTATHGDYDEVIVPIETLALHGAAVPKPQPGATPMTDNYGNRLCLLADSVGCRKLAVALLAILGTAQPARVTLFDVSKDANAKRFHVVDMVGNSVASITCGVGARSDPNDTGHATIFSNVSGSHCTSLGAFKYEAQTYQSSIHGTALRMHGLESTNSNMFSRDIITHTAWYVSDDHAGHSDGCQAIAEAHHPIIATLVGCYGIIGLAQ